MSKKTEIIKANLVRADFVGLKIIDTSFSKCSGYKCIECGRGVSPATVKYYDYDVSRVLCYDCQEGKPYVNDKQSNNGQGDGGREPTF